MLTNRRLKRRTRSMLEVRMHSTAEVLKRNRTEWRSSASSAAVVGAPLERWGARVKLPDTRAPHSLFMVTRRTPRRLVGRDSSRRGDLSRAVLSQLSERRTPVAHPVQCMDTTSPGASRQRTNTPSATHDFKSFAPRRRCDPSNLSERDFTVTKSPSTLRLTHLIRQRSRIWSAHPPCRRAATRTTVDREHVKAVLDDSPVNAAIPRLEVSSVRRANRSSSDAAAHRGSDVPFVATQ